jgi:hypothetical protein
MAKLMGCSLEKHGVANQTNGQAFDLKGQQGEVFQVLNDYKGRTISPTLPVIVAFGRFRAHFRSDELEAVA